MHIPNDPQWKTFDGVSANESFDEAYKNAVDKAYADLGRSPDAMIETRVESIQDIIEVRQISRCYDPMSWTSAFFYLLLSQFPQFKLLAKMVSMTN